LNAQIASLAQRVLDGQSLDRADARLLTRIQGQDLYDLFYWANKIRVRFAGPDVKFCAIVAAKVGGCSEDCKFCAQSEHYSTAVKGQDKLSDEQVLQSADHAGAVGADSFGIVNSGRGPTRDELQDWLKPLMMKIAQSGKTRACATLGALTPETARFLYDCGIRRINHNIETSQRHYGNIVSTHPFAERINTLKIAKDAGLSLCSGGIFGMGEDWDDRIDMALTLRDLGVDVVPINFLNAIHDAVPEDHLPVSFSPSRKGTQSGRGARSLSARSPKLDLLRRRRFHHDRQLSHHLRPKPRNGPPDGARPGSHLARL
jgi:biotin synthase